MRKRRLIRLVSGLILYGFAGALMVRADLGLSPWNVFHQGLARLSGLSFGLAVNLTGIALLLLWIPLRERIGIGTILNALIIGTAADGSLQILPASEGVAIRWGLLAAGILLTGLASGIYIGAGLGPGPRDGLMTGLARTTGLSIRAARMVVEFCALLIGVALGGTAGVGTLAYALSIGALAQFFLTKFGWEAEGVRHQHVREGRTIFGADCSRRVRAALNLKVSTRHAD